MPQQERDLSLDFHSLRARYDAGTLTPTALVQLLVGKGVITEAELTEVLVKLKSSGS